ncbi:malto-oligosyltrehalose trehalohydrolase [Pluralibacter gergoviae]|uniref:Malto-oligosyltrehalose trehalohydrolase n=1 Tax=Pluralibacter gergoviae TaxID=61647 RepID=A0AAW8HWK1_PLUGE|nr:malto-oligosyltrehalose trehalohydrolase [Pluralibacter gergoviae]AVR04252.1 malto-oligosyltrehalose trehalohydrolase [Pluralibacter gergoviae]KMK07020.1 malto-oligosyltrehalose trehalohydrolase [Pluralibacter gergoviae]KMK27738.1 malto-oligosyltrehalose trehalohydrolase [Pluralibacter gergoviae]MDQ2312108.1 malto-oligosyltrehalose trehalohydrolase [Pluralibacter gergoviae]HDS1115089.1 malto-oligosyltrehalose trehalohydrolase [Pluralibacter gergoviae]
MENNTFHKRWGAEFIADNAVRFRVWAEGQASLTLRLAGRELAMTRSPDGWFEIEAADVVHGDEYQFLLADGTAVADPASRAQADSVNGPSLVIDPRRYPHRQTAWRGRPWEETVIYELHIGTFTPEGTLRAAIERLPYLAGIGITQLEVMPVAQFGGSRGWGYDGVLLYAVHSAYGTPGDFHAFIDAAHALGMSVVLDIVLNHFGPEGNYLPRLSPGFFDSARMTPWGNGIAYQNPAVRDYIRDAPLFWLSEYRLDGLRFDAIDQIEDDPDDHVLVEIAQRIRQHLPDRHVHLTTEDSRNVIFLHPRDEDGGAPLFTGEWNDDYHNAAHVFATGETRGYYQDFAERPGEKLARAMAEGFAYQGEVSPQTGEPRGVPCLGQPPSFFVDFIQNHDQTGNRAQGERLIALAGADATRILQAALLLSPHVPLLFMGEEYGETRPFLFFTDFHGELAKAVREGRAKEFAGHAGHGDAVPDPNDLETFRRSKLDWQRMQSADGQAWLALVRALIALRQRRIAPLIAHGAMAEGRVLQAEDRAVAVQWRFDNVTLSLALNLDSDALPDLPGEVLFRWPRAQDAQDAIIVCLADGDNAL